MAMKRIKQSVSNSKKTISNDPSQGKIMLSTTSSRKDFNDIFMPTQDGMDKFLQQLSKEKD